MGNLEQRLRRLEAAVAPPDEQVYRWANSSAEARELAAAHTGTAPLVVLRFAESQAEVEVAMRKEAGRLR